MNQEQEDFYKKFKERLEESQEFPSNYLFKFIVPNNDEKIKEIKEVFAKSNAGFSFKESKNGKYVSVTIKLYVTDSDEVVKYYKQAGEIKEVILL